MHKLDEVYFYDNDDSFFEILSPKEVSFSYRMRMAKSIGSTFTKNFKAMKMHISNPLNGCSDFLNSRDIVGGVALIQRGYEISVFHYLYKVL